MGMSVEATSNLDSVELYGLDINTKESDWEERSVKVLGVDRHFSIFSETVNQLPKNTYQNEKIQPLMSKAPDVDFKAGYNDKDGKFVEFKVSWKNEESSQSESSSKADADENPNASESSDRGGESKSGGDATERPSTRW